MPTLICYDVESNTLRTRLSKKILEYGLERINRSVYLGAPTERELAQLETQLCQWMVKLGKPNDSLIFLPVTAQQVLRMLVIGRNDFTPEELSGEIDTLIF